VLKKSDFTRDQNFAEAPAHSSENDVGDRITDPISNGKPPQALYKSLNYQSSVSTAVPQNFAVISFLSFSTISTQSGHHAEFSENGKLAFTAYCTFHWFFSGRDASALRSGPGRTAAK
jgi:hypothetical protein